MHFRPPTPPKPTPPVATHLEIPSDAVPWAPLPFAAYVPTPLPSPAPPAPGPAPQCGATELAVTSLDALRATGNDGVVVELTNTSPTTCLAEDYPRVTVDDSDHAGILATSGGFFDGGTPIGDIPPGAMAAFIVSGASGCSTQSSAPYATRLAAQLPGGGNVSVVLPGTYPFGSNASRLTLPTSCGVWATHLYPYPVRQTPPSLPADPLALLTATIRVPISVVEGHPIVYVIDLHNPGDHPVALSPCRGYRQTLDNEKTPSFAYELNCADARMIPPGGDEPFVIEMPSYAAPPGEHTVCWNLDAGISSKPPTCARLKIVS